MTPRKSEVIKMFDEISPRYDLLNHLLSLGIDFFWRRKLVRLLGMSSPKRILDVATGTGDVAIAMARLGPGNITGIDIAEKMLEIGRRKVAGKGLAHIITFQGGDAENLPFQDETFDAVTVAFGVRNFEDLRKGLSEMRRVLKTGGIMMILEFSHPDVTPMKQLYRFYSRFVIPFIGKMISRHSEAYRYLPESVAAFPSGKVFIAILEDTGMKDCRRVKLSSGIASIYTGIA